MEIHGYVGRDQSISGGFGTIAVKDAFLVVGFPFGHLTSRNQDGHRAPKAGDFPGGDFGNCGRIPISRGFGLRMLRLPSRETFESQE